MRHPVDGAPFQWSQTSLSQSRTDTHSGIAPVCYLCPVRTGWRTPAQVPLLSYFFPWMILRPGSRLERESECQFLQPTWACGILAQPNHVSRPPAKTQHSLIYSTQLHVMSFGISWSWAFSQSIHHHALCFSGTALCSQPAALNSARTQWYSKFTTKPKCRV